MPPQVSESVIAGQKAQAILRRYDSAAAAFRQHAALDVDAELGMSVETSLSSGEIDALKAVGYTAGAVAPAAGELDPLTATTADYLALLSTSLTVADAATCLNVDRSRIRQRLRARSLFGIEQNGEWRRTVPTVMDRDDGSLVAQVVSAEVRDLIVDSLNAGIASALDFKPENESDAFREEWDRLKDEPSFTLRVKGQDPDFSHIATYSDWLNITSEQARRILAMLSEEAVA